jgi:D-glycero-beta-D-manno-heptose-7-phosphate kinase
MKTTPTREHLLQAIDRMAGVRVLVVADLVLDEFEHGEIARISREAPVLILNHRRTDRLPGGGANAINNIHALDGRPAVIGRLGQDEAGDALLELLRRDGVDVSGIWRDPSYATPVKRRILAGSPHSVKQQIVRIDRGGGAVVDLNRSPLPSLLTDRVAAAQAVLVSDYGLGLLNAGTAASIAECVLGGRRPLFVDSRVHLRLFRGMNAATPNLQEAEALLGEPVGDDPAKLRRAGEALRASLDAESLVLTQGSLGMTVFTRSSPPFHLPVYGTDEVADVTGAGDTVIGALTLAFLAGCGHVEAALLANYAGGIVVMKRGTATVTREDLRHAVRTDPFFDRRLLPA